MKYFVKNVSKSQYTSTKLILLAGTEEEVEKDIYDYLNTSFGTSGRFTFRTDKTEAKVEKKVEAKVEKKTEAKVEKKVEAKASKAKK